MLPLPGCSSIDLPHPTCPPRQAPLQVGSNTATSSRQPWLESNPPPPKVALSHISSKQPQSEPVSPIQSSSHPTTPERWLWREQCQQLLGLAASKTRGDPAHHWSYVKKSLPKHNRRAHGMNTVDTPVMAGSGDQEG